MAHLLGTDERVDELNVVAGTLGKGTDVERKQSDIRDQFFHV